MASALNQAPGKLLTKAQTAVSRATVRALNNVAAATRTRAVRAIQEDVGASSQKSIRKFIAVDRATERRQESRVIARTKKDDRIPIYELKPQPRQPARRRRPIGTGVIWGPERRLIPGAFVQRMPSGHIGVFVRRSAAQLPITEARGPSASWVFGKSKIQTVLKKFIGDKIGPELVTQARFYGAKVGIGVD